MPREKTLRISSCNDRKIILIWLQMAYEKNGLTQCILKSKGEVSPCIPVV